MAIALSLFDDEPEQSKAEKNNAAHPLLPLIPMVKKKASKNDTPLEKEIRRFNNYIKELYEYEEQAKQNKAEDEQAHVLYLTKIVPLLTEIAQARVNFVKHTERLFYNEKASKRLEKDFVFFVLTMLEQATAFNEEAREMFAAYVDKQLSLLSKNEKKKMDKAFAEEEMFDEITEDDNRQYEKEYFYQDDNDFTQKNHSTKKHTKTPAAISITELYKELVKMLHPDLEQDAEKRHTKEQLMKQLTTARDEQDLFAMLLLKQKAYTLQDATPAENNYTLEKLKLYNKTLKQKIDIFKNSLKNQFLKSIVTDRNGFITSIGKTNKPEEKINLQVKELKRMKKSFDDNLTMMRDHDDVEIMLMDFMEEF